MENNIRSNKGNLFHVYCNTLQHRYNTNALPKAADHVRSDHRVNGETYTRSTAENYTNEKRKCVLFLSTILHIFGVLSGKFKLF